MPLIPTPRKQLQTALLDAFRSREELARVVRYGLDENLNQITAAGPLASVVFELMEWAESQDRLDALIKEAREENPGNRLLKEFATNYAAVPRPAPADPAPAAPDSGAASTARNQVFISYSHKDKKWLQKLQVMLAPLDREGRIKIWDDTQITPGARWREEIEKALAAARVAVLLVSSNFLASDFIAHQELPPLLEAAARDHVRILWVAVGPSLYKATPIAAYQAVNDPAKPLNSLSPAKQEQEILHIAEQIAAAANTQ
jgi:hypothetical protein